MKEWPIRLLANWANLHENLAFQGFFFVFKKNAICPLVTKVAKERATSATQKKFLKFRLFIIWRYTYLRETFFWAYPTVFPNYIVHQN
jgi:hypothetical protein